MKEPSINILFSVIETNCTILNRIILKFPHLGPQLAIGIHSMGMIWWAITCNITYILPGHLPTKETTLLCNAIMILYSVMKEVNSFQN